MLVKKISVGLIVLGAAGLLVSLLGEVTSLGQYQNSPPRSWEQFDKQLVLETPDLGTLLKRSNALTKNLPTHSEQEKMLAIYNLVINRFSHGDQAKYNLFSNWIIWLMGKIDTNFSYIRQPNSLVEKGHSALCSEQAFLLQTLAENQGIRTRSVGLDGHVVMEAWYDNDWHLYDPDLEVVPLMKNQTILSLDELAKSPNLVQKYYAGRGDDGYIKAIVGIITSRENNSFSSYPKLVLFEWKSHILFHFEKIANFMKWIIPIIFLIIGYWLIKNKRKNKCVA